MRVICVLLCVMALQSACLAGTNDYIQVMLRACDQNGNYTQFNCECSTNPVASDGLDSADSKAPATYAETAWISCYDLGPGIGLGYCIDRRAPVTAGTKTWNLRVRAGASWQSPKVYLRVWNPVGYYDINGTIPISLRVVNDPTGTYSPGASLIASWDLTQNGHQAVPAYSFAFDNAAALLGGSAIELQFVVGGSPPVECSVGEARRDYAGQVVALSNVTASSGSGESAGLWVTSDGLPGLCVSPGVLVDRGEVVDVQGQVSWIDGVPYLTNPVIVDRHGTGVPGQHAMSCAALGNDPSESLSYRGVNPIGKLCVACGLVTARDESASVFYLEDGSNLTDGLSVSGVPATGLRVVCEAGASLPAVDSHVRVTGIRSVEKHVLEAEATVNGEVRQSGETIYVPVLLTRAAGDVVAICP